MVKPSSAVSPYPPSAFPSTSSGTLEVELQPTWKGFIHTTHDALIIVEATLQGKLSHIARRPHEKERGSVILSGNVFVYEENASGIKRWTDGIQWSPSRIMNNFLVYRELDQPWPQGQKKVAKKRKRSADHGTDVAPSTAPEGYVSQTAEEDRRLVGSLVDSYGFKQNGLVKRTLTITHNGVAHHIISYYTLADIKNGKFHRPLFDPKLRDISPRLSLINNPHLKFPLHDNDEMDPYAQPPAIPQQIIPQNYTMPPSQGFQAQPPTTVPVQPSAMSFQPSWSTNAHSMPTSPASITQYHIPITDGTMSGMAAPYDPGSLALQTNLLGPVPADYSSGMHDSGISTPNPSSSGLGIDASEQSQPAKRQRTDISPTSTHTSMPAAPTPVSMAPEYDHSLGVDVNWVQFQNYLPVSNPVADLSTALSYPNGGGFYAPPAGTLLDNQQIPLWSNSVQAQQY